MGQTPYLSKKVLYKSSENKQNTQMKSFKVVRQWLPVGRSREPGFGAFQSKQRALNGKGTVIKNSPANAGDVRDTGLVPESGRSLGGGHGNPLPYSCLGNPIDRGSWQAAVHRVVPMQARALVPLWPRTSIRGTADPTSPILQVCQDSRFSFLREVWATRAVQLTPRWKLTTLNPQSFE